MKRLFAFVALAVLVLATGTASGAYYDGENDGSSWENAYVIESSADLSLMCDRVNNGSDDVGKYYKLSADIDLTSLASWEGIGHTQYFTGHFDGQDHTITHSSTESLFYNISSDKDTIAVRNLNITGNVTNSQITCPLARYLDSGIVENCSFIGTVKSTNSVACGLVYRVRGGTIRNCTVSGDILSSVESGGIAVSLEYGTIENCTVEAGTKITASVDWGGVNAGGIAGSMSGGTIINCIIEDGATITASNDAGGIVGYMFGGMIENCTVNDGTTITASGYVGGIAGNASGDVTFSGNTWPAGYPQAGNSFSDILAKIATTLGATPVRVPDSAFTSATPVTSSDTASDRQYAASHDMFIAVAISPMASLADGAYYHPVTFSTLPSGRTLATSADFSFYPDGLGANMTSAYVAVFNASGDEVTEPSSVLGKEGYIAFIIENGSIRGTSSDNSLNRPTLTLPLASAGNNNTPTVVDSVLNALKDSGYVNSNNQLTNLAFVSGSIPTLTLASDGTYTATVSLKFDVSSWNFAVADNGSVTKQFSSSQFSLSSIGNDSLTPTSSNTARISLDPSEISSGSHAVTLTVTPIGATHTASVSLGNVIGTSNAQYYSRGNDGSSWENAYIIASYQDLISMRDRVNDGSDGNGKYYKLSADIDLTTTSGTSWNIRTFTGHFDGQGHTITLSSTNPFFYDISSDKDTIAVRNLNITGNVTDSQIACPLAINLYSGIVENCNFIGTVKSTNSVACGLVYSVEGETIRNCTVSADILSSEWSGGIAGSLEKGAIENCTIESGTRITTLSFDAGGIVGWIIGGGTVENCTVEAGTIITASNDAGGIVGDASNGTITSCTVENGVSIAGRLYTGGIAGRSYSTTLSGNTWPSSYSQTGTRSANNEGSNGGNAAPSSTPNPTPQITWNGHRYQAYNENLTWEEAKSRCESLGGHLATITSSLEQEQAENLLRQSTTSQRGYWLGASADISGFWKWTTGEEFERQYMNFPGGQQESSGNYLYMYWTPNSAEGTITASAATNQGEWDCAGNASYGFICEWDNEPSTVQEAPTDSDFQRWQQDPDAYRNTEQSGVPAGSNPSPIDTSHLASNPPNVETPGSIPVSFDARKEGRLPPVRNQGIYETCWAFAALGAMEADYMTHNMASLGTSPDLSELHLAWFAYKDPSSDSYKEGDFNILMEGADPEVAASFLRRSAISPVNEESMPYAAAGNIEEQANQNVITFLNGRTAGSFNKARISITGVLPLDRIPQDGASTINTIKSHIMQHGAVYFSYENLQQGYNDDKTSFYSENEGSPHAALLVGWDDNYPASNFRNTPPANGAWLVRTSRWAEDTTKEIVSTGDEYGCFWMSYSQAYGNNARSGFSGIRLFTVSEDMHEVKENGGSLHTKDITPAWSARIFRAGRNERLIRIGFDTTDNNASYQIFVNKFTGTPTDPGRAENPVLSGDIPNAGYHTLNLPTPIDLYEGNYYAVIVKMLMSPSSSYRYPTAVGASMDKYAQIEVNEAESFFAEGNEVPSVWQDGINVEGGPYKACIMTFTEARTTFDTAPSIMTSSLPDATVGQHYSFILSSSGTQAIEWRSGNIPEDFTLSRTGTLTGQPQEAGQYDINLTAVNDVGYVEKVLSLTVNAAGNTNDSETNDNNTDNTQTDNTNQEQDKTPDDDNTQNDTQQEDETPSPLNASGGGCDSGIQIAGLAVIFILAGVKRWRRK